MKPCWARARRRTAGPEALRKRNACCAPARRSREDCLLGDLLTGAAPRVLNDALLRAAGLERHSREPLRPLLSARPGAIAALARAIVDFQVAVTARAALRTRRSPPGAWRRTASIL